MVEGVTPRAEELLAHLAMVAVRQLRTEGVPFDAIALVCAFGGDQLTAYGWWYTPDGAAHPWTPTGPPLTALAFALRAESRPGGQLPCGAFIVKVSVPLDAIGADFLYGPDAGPWTVGPPAVPGLDRAARPAA